MGNFSEKLGEVSAELIAMAPFSAGLERVFSLMGDVHSEIRNGLKPKKVRKLPFCMWLLNSASFSELLL